MTLKAAATTTTTSPAAGERSWLLMEQEQNDDYKDEMNNASNNKRCSKSCLIPSSTIKHIVGIALGIVLGYLISSATTSSTNDTHHQKPLYIPEEQQHNIRSSTSTTIDAPPTTTTTTTIPSSTAAEQPVDGIMSTNSKYINFQALNFQLYTGGAPVMLDDNTTNPECIGFLGNKDRTVGVIDTDDGGNTTQCYLGHKDVDLDVTDRLQIMYDAIETAYEQSSKESDTMKIFVAPEFFFRGRNGAYLVNHHHQHLLFQEDDNGQCHAEICKILKGLEKYVADKRFKDWLFLFGTVVLAEPLPTEDEYDYLFYNFGLLYKGYDPDNETHAGKRFLVPKRYVSTSDFLQPTEEDIDNHKMKHTREIYQDGQVQLHLQNNDNIDDDDDKDSLYVPLKKKYDRRLWHTYKNELERLDYTMIEYGWFMMDGISLSVEICLDHDLRTALSAYLVDSVLPQPTLIPSSSSSNGKSNLTYVDIPRYQAQISLVASAGMTVSETSLALVHGGSIILQDGQDDLEPEKVWVYECYKYEWQFVGGSEVIQRIATMTPTEVAFDYDVKKNYEKHSIYYNNDDDDDSSSNGRKAGGWKQSLRGVFSNAKYEPMIRVFEPAPIAKVF